MRLEVWIRVDVNGVTETTKSASTSYVFLGEVKMKRPARTLTFVEKVSVKVSND